MFLGSGIIRPALRSIQDLHKAIELLEEAGEMRGSLAATAMKDLGLVYGFIHWFAGQTGTTLQELQTDEGYPPNRRDPEVEAEAWSSASEPRRLDAIERDLRTEPDDHDHGDGDDDDDDTSSVGGRKGGIGPITPSPL